MTDNQNRALRKMATDYSGDRAVHTLKELCRRFVAVEIIIFDEAAPQIALSAVRSPLESSEIGLAQSSKETR
jgi:hypothetical protein